MKSLRLLFALIFTAPALAIDPAHRAAAEQAIAKAHAYLATRQDKDGAWSPKPGPAVTGLVVASLLQAGRPATDPVVARGLNYILARQKDTGGIFDSLLENYNTGICLMALGRVKGDAKVDAAVAKAQNYLRDLQWGEGMKDAQGKLIDKNHPWYGGAGYGNHGRPDLSNTAMMLAGLNDSGLNCNDPAFQRAMVFIQSLQGVKSNTAFGDKIESSGGFIYATSVDKDNIGTPQSQSTQTVTDAAGKSRLRAYGSMTYAGFMSYLYAKLDKDDPHVKDAYQWIRNHYTVKENPGLGPQGYYYYLHLLSRALQAWGDPSLTTAQGEKRDWANDLIDQLLALQKPDGSWINEKDRWMEGDPNLVTSYALLALQHALR